jgi:hypothetical protein
VLKHVCDVGSFGPSAPSRWTTIRSAPSPPIGARSLPVKNFKKSFFSSSEKSRRTMDQSHWHAEDEALKPPSYLALRSSASKSRLGLPVFWWVFWWVGFFFVEGGEKSG